MTRTNYSGTAKLNQLIFGRSCWNIIIIICLYFCIIICIPIKLTQHPPAYYYIHSYKVLYKAHISIKIWDNAHPGLWLPAACAVFICLLHSDVDIVYMNKAHLPAAALLDHNQTYCEQGSKHFHLDCSHLKCHQDQDFKHYESRYEPKSPSVK